MATDFKTGLLGAMQDPMFQLGIGLLGRRDQNFGRAFGGAARDMSLSQMALQQARDRSMQTQQEQEQQQREQEWIAQNMPGVAGAPGWAQQAAGTAKFAQPKVNPKMVMGPGGKPMWANAPEAIGQQAYSKPLVSVSMDQGNRAKYLTDEEKIQGGFDPAQPMVWNAKGIPTPIKATSFTEGQLQAAGYANRMVGSEDVLEDLVERGFSPGKLREYAAAQGGIAGNYMMTPEGRQYRQAQEDWVRAKLRKESGAVIAKEEMNQEIATYFPMPGDDEGTIANKKAARDRAVKGMIRMTGGAIKPATNFASPKSKEQSRPIQQSKPGKIKFLGFE